MLYRFMNSDTLAALQILQSEVHPQAHYQGPTNTNSGSKEGLSVYGLFQNLARTPQGKHLLRQYFLRPSLEMNVINERLNTSSVFLRTENDHALKGIAKSLGQIKNMKTVMIHLRKGVSNGQNKGGGIRCGVWSSLRSVRDDCFKALCNWLILLPVYISHVTSIRLFWRSDWCRKSSNQNQSGLSPFIS